MWAGTPISWRISVTFISIPKASITLPLPKLFFLLKSDKSLIMVLNSEMLYGFNTKYDAPEFIISRSRTVLWNDEYTINTGTFVLSRVMLLITPIASSLVINESISTTSGLSLLILSHNSSPSFAQKITEIFLLCKILRFSCVNSEASSVTISFILLFIVISPSNFCCTNITTKW